MKKQYPSDIKLKVVEHYLNTSDGMKRTAHLFGIGRTAVRRWITTYQLHGLNGISDVKKSYDTALKIAVAKAVVDENLSLLQAAAKYNISNESVVRGWAILYEREGTEGLSAIKKGQRKAVRKPVRITKATERLTPAEMQDEIAYLQAEVAYLKKLEALVQKQAEGKKPKRLMN